MKKFLLFMLLFVNLHIVMTVSAQKIDKTVELKEVVIEPTHCTKCGVALNGTPLSKHKCKTNDTSSSYIGGGNISWDNNAFEGISLDDINSITGGTNEQHKESTEQSIYKSKPKNPYRQGTWTIHGGGDYLLSDGIGVRSTFSYICTVTVEGYNMTVGLSIREYNLQRIFTPTVTLSSARRNEKYSFTRHFREYVTPDKYDPFGEVYLNLPEDGSAKVTLEIDYIIPDDYLGNQSRNWLIKELTKATLL